MKTAIVILMVMMWACLATTIVLAFLTLYTDSDHRAWMLLAFMLNMGLALAICFIETFRGRR